MKRIIIVVTLFLFITNNIVAQINGSEGQKVTVLSPNTESFKIFGDIPVSLYTGIPSIGVPIHEVKNEYINLSLSLSYHASGFKPDSHPSWVGLGWNLNVGGVISREVKYIKDELSPTDSYCSSKGSGTGGRGFYFSHNVLNKSNWNVPTDPSSTNAEFGSPEYLLDRSPDIFSFNFLGYSGKFYLNHLGEWKVQSETPLKVEFDKNDLKTVYDFSDPTFTKFTIVDEKGVKYVFGGKDAIEYTVSMQPCNYDYVKESLASSWYLSEIIPPIGESIIFNYERGPFQSSFTGRTPSMIQSRYSGNNYVANNYILTNVSGSITSPVYLTSIFIPNENLTISFKTSKSNDLNYFETNYSDLFYYTNSGAGMGIVPGYFLGFNTTNNIPFFDRNPEEKEKASSSGRYRKDKFVWLKLDEINFSYSSVSGTTYPSKTIKLGYEENSKSRLKLTSVSTQYPNSTQNDAYTFEYNKRVGKIDNVAEPEYLSEYGDQWGYANGKYLWLEKDKKNSRDALKGASMLSVLTKITYPTKGYTQFNYENHEYSSYVDNSMFTSSLINEGSSVLTGGLRIKRIVSVDEHGGYTAKEYTYRKKDLGKQSSGILHAKPAYYSLADKAFLFDNSGAHIGYSTVVEKYNDGSFKATDFITEDSFSRLGETVQARFDDSPAYVESWVSLVPYSSRDFERGKISDEYFCDSQGKVIKSTHYNYTNIGKDASNSIRTADTQYMKYLDRLTMTFSGHTAYYYYTYYNKLESIREIVYNRDAGINYGNTSKPPVDKSVTSKMSFSYDKYGQKIKETIEMSNSSKKEIETKYSYTDNSSSSTLGEMVKRNMLDYPIERKISVGGLFQERLKFNYALYNNNKHILLQSLTEEYKEGVTNTRFEYKYNLSGKLIESKPYTGLTESYLWGYKGQKVMAIISNASINDVKSFVSEDLIEGKISGNDWDKTAITLRSKLPNANIESYEYLYNGNLKSRSNIAGVKMNYVYDKENRLESLNDMNGNILSNYSYNYSNSTQKTYLNIPRTITQGKDCPGDSISIQTIDYDIPGGIYLSSISQSDADSKAHSLHLPYITAIVNEKCKCLRYGTYSVESTDIATVNTANIVYIGDEIIIYYIRITWSESMMSNKDQFYYMYGNPIGKLKRNPALFPSKLTTCEFIEEGSKNKAGTGPNVWVISIDKDGVIYARLKNYSIDAAPTQNVLYISGDLALPL